MDNKLIYLCGPISGLDYNGAMSWRDTIINELPKGVIGLNPMRNEDHLKNKGIIEDCYNDTVMSSAKSITIKDRYDTMRADMIIANFLDCPKVSIGSVMEIGWADAVRTPVIVIMDDDNIHNHAMIRETASWVVPTVNDAIGIVKSIYGYESEHKR